VKRSGLILALSREHHQALVFARRIALQSDSVPELAALGQRVLDELAPALLVHFEEEEQGLLPVADDTAAENARRLVAEHEQLRALLGALREGDVNALKPFGALLADHVRFEERTLFPQIAPLLGN
jgi:hypothetical protein